MSDRSGLSRGDRNRNAQLARLREAVPSCNAIAGIDLADARQMVVVTDHESRVLARRVFQRRAWQLGAALDWAASRVSIPAWRGSRPSGASRSPNCRARWNPSCTSRQAKSSSPAPGGLAGSLPICPEYHGEGI